MASVIAEVSDALVTALKAGTFSKPFDPIRNWGEATTKLSDDSLKVLRCDVVPVRHAVSEDQTRGHLTYDTEHDIVFRYRFGKSERGECGLIHVDEIDQLCELTEEVHEYLMHQTLADTNASEWKSSRILWCPYKIDIRTNHQFTGLIRVTFQTDKAQP